VLTISAREDASVKLAVEKVNALIKHHENLTSTISVPKEKLDLALSAKKDASKLHFHVLDGPEKDSDLQVVIYGAEFEERERIVEKIEHLLETCVIEKIVLPSTLSASVTSSVIGALIGKSGANIRALQKEFPGVAIDIRRSENSISLKGPSDEVLQVKSVMEDKVQELLRNQEARSANSRYNNNSDAAAEDEEKPKTKKPSGSGSAAAAADVEETQGGDENSQPRSNAQQRPHIPVGAMPSMVVGKLDKNQRRRMRKRAENEKQSDVLSMIMSGSSSKATSGATTTTTTTSEESGYYHSSSGYSLRL
jgi:hypothetical protein